MAALTEAANCHSTTLIRHSPRGIGLEFDLPLLQYGLLHVHGEKATSRTDHQHFYTFDDAHPQASI